MFNMIILYFICLEPNQLTPYQNIQKQLYETFWIDQLDLRYLRYGHRSNRVQSSWGTLLFYPYMFKWNCGHPLTHWGRVTHICVTKLTIIGSDNGLSPDWRQVIIWTNAGSLLMGPLGTNFSEILIEIITFSFKKMRLKVSSAKRWPFCLGLNVLTLGVWYTCVSNQ